MKKKKERQSSRKLSDGPTNIFCRVHPLTLKCLFKIAFSWLKDYVDECNLGLGIVITVITASKWNGDKYFMETIRN